MKMKNDTTVAFVACHGGYGGYDDEGRSKVK